MSAPPDRREQAPVSARGPTYAEFLHLDALLAATDPVPDEVDGRYFVVVHQAFELWFRLVVDELEAGRDALIAGRLRPALYRLRRVVVVDRLLVDQLRALAAISPTSFQDLRPHLGAATGMQSAQFREIEYLSGLRGRDPVPGTARDPAERERLARRLREPTVWDAFRAAARARGVVDPVQLYRPGPVDAELLEVAETLLDHDQAWASWRSGHALAVARIIGTKPGTGGTAGVDYLNSRRDERFYPQLWEARSRL